MTQVDDCSSDDSYSTVSSTVSRSTTINEERIYRVACLGTPGCGKSQLLFTYCSGFPLNWVKEIFDNYHKKVLINNSKNIHLEISETNSIEELESIKGDNGLNHIDCFLICFSITNRKSFESCYSLWYQELIKNNLANTKSSTPIILIGTKNDLRNTINNKNENYYSNNESYIEDPCNDGKPYVSYDEGLEMSKKIGAAHFFEISSLLNKTGSIEDLFNKIAVVVYNKNKSKNKKKKSGCIIN
ncbi:hypothetical protein DICPUDRAFT_81475 [Dictyostelium purpureum]|uniref:Uncharacterized protein n=1 Tax=Dictyostelium purpureum TaxID=5786 RepID=F0ZTL4_DICPU|nr:uncharacterized protein DICPUDRAFT_81475 [Dictyostelium purpureum]EGC32718.1 hypothetical protein DICPUDRAFT_81475 [Dictyostelium purpureum]|eukprot:XP_003290751.1 hypothetical protein DICPUDRAFT_81475 [Dictyostelium purpureum]